jgi:hypothetical protein
VETQIVIFSCVLPVLSSLHSFFALASMSTHGRPALLFTFFSQGIYPLKDVFIRKVKLLKAPKFDISKLNEAHEGSSEDTGKKVSA